MFPPRHRADRLKEPKLRRQAVKNDRQFEILKHRRSATEIRSSALDRCASLHDQNAACLLVEIVEKLVAARRQRADVDDAFTAGGDHLFNP